ncbi:MULTISPECIES: LysE family translocator [Gammaproteobacteria]|uniref:LysE family translocator n=1 Tax=Gammaproteobacteria TaxID=1236 RepID=UPI000DCF66DA|nr:MULTISPECIES: LysE family translocator [Gammaproteobacteria]RTE87195.1 LysE family translocator [Aliidiomarina sp. B3213]TCZ93017.1 LysE family translocator [Lysobacter sp. N42]
MFWESPYFQEFLTIAVLHFLAVASPGPDFAVVSRYAVRYGAGIGFWVSLGVGLGILVHVTYSILGLSLIIHETPWLYKLLNVAAAGYFLWLAYHLLQSKPEPVAAQDSAQPQIPTQTIKRRKALWTGFLTNGLNVKATMFFLALFTSVIAVTTPTQVKVGYGMYLALATFAWFALLSVLLGRTRLRFWLLKHGYWFDRLMGLLLGLLGLKFLFELWV